MIEINGVYANAIVYTDEIEASASRSKFAPSTTSNPATGSPAKRRDNPKGYCRHFEAVWYAITEVFMTKNEVKQAIQRGLGRGYLAVRNDPDRYRDLVLWACGRNLAFDTQCEGTRAWYDYQLILCYSDRAAFRDHVIERFQRKQPDGGWDYSHFSELLSYFAEDGDGAAEAALWEKYKELLAALHSFRRSSRRMRNTQECFETICVALSWKEENYSRISLDVGGLFLKSRLYDGWDFMWLYDRRPKRFHQRLRKSAEKSAEISVAPCI